MVFLRQQVQVCKNSVVLNPFFCRSEANSGKGKPALAAKRRMVRIAERGQHGESVAPQVAVSKLLQGGLQAHTKFRVGHAVGFALAESPAR